MYQSLISEELFSQMVSLRRQLHRHPELSFEEVDTAKTIMSELDRIGIPYEYVGREGAGAVVGRLVGSVKTPATHSSDRAIAVALRADMDALPGAESTDLPFASEIADKVHACGHDAHMAMVLGAAALLKSDPPGGDVLFVFQPAEEKGGGARVVTRSDVLGGVRAIFGGHVTHHYAVGEMMVAAGVITAQSDRFRIKITGKGGHGARPHEAIDAVVITGALISTIQTLISREVNPVHPSVVTIGTINAGSAANVIAGEALMEGSIRTTQSEAREQIHQGLQRMVDAMALLHDAQIELEISEGYPPVVNTQREAQIAHRAAVQVVGCSGLMQLDHPSMGSEDFSYYLEQMDGCYVRFGARLKEREYIPLHSPAFDIDEQVLKVGAAFFERCAREALTDYSSNPEPVGE